MMRLISRYLECLVANDLSDDEDIKRQFRPSCGRANMLIRKFHRSSEQVSFSLALIAPGL